MYEYDLSKANISALMSENRIDESTYQRLYYADRMTRQIEIGLMEKNDHSITKAKKHGITEAKRQLFLSNQIEDWEVLSIKNDAVFILGRELPYTSFGRYFTFAKKNTYTIFLILGDLEIYYFDEMIGDGLNVSIDVKGINDSLLPLHEHGMLDLIVETCYSIQRDTPRETVQKVSTMYEKFIKRELPVDCYREMNYISKFKFQSQFSAFYTDVIAPEQLQVVDIGRNLNLIRDLMAIVSSIYINSGGRR